MIIKAIHTNAILKEIPTEGHSPLRVLGSDYQMYVAKNDKGKVPPYSLINEFLASYFLNKWEVATPEIKLITIAPALILAKDNLSINHKPHYYNTPCFGSKYIENAIDVNALIVTEKKKAFNKINNPLDVFHITLFDTWVENDDRKPTNYNLILEPHKNKFNVIAIDNAFIFSTMSYKDLNPEFVAASGNDHLLVSDLGYLIKKYIQVTNSFINNEREYFYLCIGRCEKDFDKFMSQIAGFYNIDLDSVIALKEFLFNKERNNKVFDEYVYRLHQ
ncbi:hypothetical protein Aeqsu_0173 [Aequorivita sublithincola DSM 14238]|uniref:HipA-like kinase domain-containing protein n=1 Tax=Aequorivita sublithincola (strain DSM 14238 / LMG 21431 / ACAM 643 / 9-3) TaxID=746697 RepID=I3YRT2_AEQSU|nr:HipA family kinase [Aequorivita sublithincola]AFL79700.1 hypothetical protein Aeqsu_0173 [Aequorivita sublithincola DSM 14238]